VNSSMDGKNNIQEESGAHIWLRYETQYDRDGRQHTLEMRIPVPIGANAETRERLFREAEEGLQQLVAHVEQRGLQMPPRIQSPSNAGRMAPQPAASTKPTPSPQTTAPRSNTPANRPASVSAPHTSMIQSSEHESASSSQPHAQEYTRPNSMNLPISEPGNNMSVPQFIQYITQNLHISPKQAMDMLNVRTLSTGINLRDALEQLKAKMGQNGTATSPSSVPSISSPPPPPTPRFPEKSGPVHRLSDRDDDDVQYEIPRAGSSGPLPRFGKQSQDHPVIEMRIPRPTPGFDEELDLEDLEEPAEIDDLGDLEDLPGDEFSQDELEQAFERINALRSLQGATTASSGRLQVLGTVVTSQITEEQLLALTNGVWNINVLKKLKVDQVEELISWAKREDNFIEQVEAILKVLEEERYARGNR